MVIARTEAAAAAAMGKDDYTLRLRRYADERSQRGRLAYVQRAHVA
jgi:hypothetical protein